MKCQDQCPRCGDDLRPMMDVMSRVFDSCIQCGYEDYKPEPIAMRSGEASYNFGPPTPRLRDWAAVIDSPRAGRIEVRLTYEPRHPSANIVLVSMWNVRPATSRALKAVSSAFKEETGLRLTHLPHALHAMGIAMDPTTEARMTAS